MLKKPSKTINFWPSYGHNKNIKFWNFLAMDRFIAITWPKVNIFGRIFQLL
jgi:hypothetical protein